MHSLFSVMFYFMLKRMVYFVDLMTNFDRFTVG